MNTGMVRSWRERSKSNESCRNSCSCRKTSQNSNRRWRVSSPSSDRTSTSTKSPVSTTSSSSKTNSKKISWTGKSPSWMTDPTWVTKRRKFIILRNSTRNHWTGWRTMMSKSTKDGSLRWKRRKLKKTRRRKEEWKTQNTLNWRKDWGNSI